MKILLINKFFYRKGGAEAYIFDLIEGLSDAGHTVVPFSMQHPDNAPCEYSRYFVDAVDYNSADTLIGNINKGLRILYSRQAARNLEALISDTHPDLAFVHNIYHQISPSVLPVIKRHRIPVVMSVHDLKLICPNYKMRTRGQICERCVPHRYYQAIMHRCVKNSYTASLLCTTEMYLHHWTGIYRRYVDAFITPSQFYKRKMIPAGYPAEKISVIPTFVNTKRYTPAYAHDDYFTYFGRLSEEKGLITLLQAMEGYRRARLRIVGSGPQARILEELVRSLRLDNVELLGPRFGDDLMRIIQGSRFSVVPSEWYENCPRSLIESYAAGKPVVGARIAGIPELIDDYKTGLLHEPFSVESLREKIAYMYEHEDDARAMGRRAREKAERSYDVAQHLRNLMVAFEETRSAGRHVFTNT